ncbi:MAG TPA: glycosyltransferase [Ktedonobacteraceae bacterium]|nr:glycosyltransferase [Ktedonobacteraceae bacterium]
MSETLQRTILFLIADTGAGHRSAANAIRNAILLLREQELAEWQKCREEANGEGSAPPLPNYRIEIVDVFEEYSHFPLREAVKLYGPAIRYNPRLYGRFFHITDKVRRVETAKAVASPLIHNGLMRLITTVKPDVIVSIHPMLNHVTINALEDLGLHIPFLTVVTDLVSVHNAWFAPGADAYIVPTETAKQLYLARGLEPKRVHVLGMPIDPRFTQPVASKEELRRKLELEPGLPVVLLVGGGEGSGGLQSCVRAISQARLPVQLLVVTGRNRRLYARLQSTRSSLHVPAKIFGFVNNMPELMHAADVIVTKAGPGTINEALTCGLPIILSGYVPGQEEGNVDFVVQHNVGMLAEDSQALVNELRKLVKPGSTILRKRLENAQCIRRPEASFDIARCILSFLPPPDQPGIWQNTRWQQPRRRLMPNPLRLTRRAASRRISARSHFPRLARSLPRRISTGSHALHLRAPGSLKRFTQPR